MFMDDDVQCISWFWTLEQLAVLAEGLLGMIK
jgi:hypothetical protein